MPRASDLLKFVHTTAEVVRPTRARVSAPVSAPSISISDAQPAPPAAKRAKRVIAYDTGSGGGAATVGDQPSTTVDDINATGGGGGGGGFALPSSPPRRARGSSSAASASTGAGAGAGAGAAFDSRALFASSSRVDAPAEAQPGSPSRGWGKPITPHVGWSQHLRLIKENRKSGGAPVDSMGCERTSDPLATPADRRFQTLVSLMLSSQTKDEVNFAACVRLRERLTGGLTAASAASADLSLLEELIYPVSFFRNKARFVKAAGVFCTEKLNGDIPDTVAGLCELSGVGPKMAFIAMDAAWGKCVGIGVDTHVHRISNRLRWCDTTDPKATQMHLQSWLPREEWGALNVLLVGFGQTVCTPVAPKCVGCSVRSLCPTGGGVAASIREVGGGGAAGGSS
jgi:endonuclease-3